MKKHFAAVAMMITLLSGLSFGAAHAAEPTSQPSSRPAAQAGFNHADYDALLKTYVNAGSVRYKTWKKNPADLARLDAYITQLGSATLTGASRNERLAFYINAYNAITLKTVLDAYPVTSIKKISGAWSRVAWRVAGKQVSLNNIEHDIVRPEFQDARIHFALVCAAKDCPPLQSRAYTAAGIDSELTHVTKIFLRSTKVDVAHKRLVVSSLFKWYGEDFVKNEGSVTAFVAKYRADSAEAAALRAGRWSVSYADYDWSLNGE